MTSIKKNYFQLISDLVFYSLNDSIYCYKSAKTQLYFSFINQSYDSLN